MDGVINNLRKRIRLRMQYAGVTPASLTPSQKELMEKFRKGIADALGVPPEAIKKEPLEKWVVEWTSAWVKPEYLRAAEEGDRLGRELGVMIKRALRAS